MINPNVFLSPAKSYMMSDNDFLFSNKLQPTTFNGYNINTEVMPIILNEFQPANTVYSIRLINELVNTGIASGKFDINALLKTSFSKTLIQSVGKTTENAMAEMVSRNPNMLYDLGDRNWAMPNPIDSIIKLFPNGRWLNVYELPFFGNEYLKADQYNNWNTGDLSQKLGDDASKFIEAGLNINLPTQPTFQLANLGQSSYGTLTTQFYLINKDDYWLSRNFRFLHAFYAGTQWVHLPMGYIKGTNVYNVLIPGRLNILWASIGSTITCEGKLRKNDFMYTTYGKTLKSITTDTLYPDAWKIKIDIKDLTPNNFNTYINYFVNGFQGSANILRTQLNQGVDNFVTMAADKLVQKFMGGADNGDIKLKQRQAEMVQSLNRTAAVDVLGQTMTQQQIEAQRRAQDVETLYSQFVTTGPSAGYNPDAKIKMPTTHDGKLDVGRLQELNFNDEQIAQISNIYSDGGISSPEEHKALYDIMYTRALNAGNEVRAMGTLQDGKRFMENTRRKQQQILYREGREKINE